MQHDGVTTGMCSLMGMQALLTAVSCIRCFAAKKTQQNNENLSSDVLLATTCDAKRMNESPCVCVCV